MTRKEKRQREREKIAGMSRKKRVEYFLTYYKWVLGVLALLILSLYFAKDWYVNSQKEEILNMILVNTAAVDTDGMKEDTRKALGAKENQTVQIDTSVRTTDDPEQKYNANVKLSVMIGSHTTDILICDKELFDSYDKDGAFLDIRELMGDEFYEAHRDEVGENYILADNSRLTEEYGLFYYDDVYIGVFVYTEHKDEAREFLEFIFEE